MRFFKKRLPAVPTGYERNDLLWSDAVPYAPALIESLPQSVHPVWATPLGLRLLGRAILAHHIADVELQRTPAGSPVHRMRARRRRLLQHQWFERAWLVAGALAEQARARYPRATPAQLLVLVRDDFRVLVDTLESGSASSEAAERDEEFAAKSLAAINEARAGRAVDVGIEDP